MYKGRQRQRRKVRVTSGDKARLPAQHDPLVEMLHNLRAEQSPPTRGQTRSTTCNPMLHLGR